MEHKPEDKNEESHRILSYSSLSEVGPVRRIILHQSTSDRGSMHSGAVRPNARRRRGQC